MVLLRFAMHILCKYGTERHGREDTMLAGETLIQYKATLDKEPMQVSLASQQLLLECATRH
eukprot:3311562-Prorocentrum_lima.AAC.1